MSDRQTIFRRFGVMWTLMDTDDGVAIVGDQGGFVMTKEQWSEWKRKVDAGYATLSDAEITEHNEALMVKHHLNEATR